MTRDMVWAHDWAACDRRGITMTISVIAGHPHTAPAQAAREGPTPRPGASPCNSEHLGSWRREQDALGAQWNGEDTAMTLVWNERGVTAPDETDTYNGCFFCYEAISYPAVFWMGSGGRIYLHPRCALELLVRLLRDVHELEHLTGSEFSPSHMDEAAALSRGR